MGPPDSLGLPLSAAPTATAHSDPRGEAWPAPLDPPNPGLGGDPGPAPAVPGLWVLSNKASGMERGEAKVPGLAREWEGPARPCREGGGDG